MNAVIHTSWLQDAPSGASAAATGLAASMGAGSALAGVDLLRTGLALAFCLALGIGAIFVIRRSHGISGKWLPEAATRRLRVVESTRLSARASLHLVEYGNRTVLLASDASGIKLLDAQDGPATEPKS